jgi:tetratricopeptide (TPR) repeat protein
MADPLNTDAYSYLAQLHFVLGEFGEAVASARFAVELAPGSPGSHVTLARMLLAAGQSEAALEEIAKDSSPGYRAYGLARTYAILGRKAEADAALAQLKQSFAADQVYDIATLHALRGETDQAFSWLERAYEQRDPNIIGIPQITVEPDLKNLRADPRFKAFLKKMNLRELPETPASP